VLLNTLNNVVNLLPQANKTRERERDNNSYNSRNLPSFSGSKMSGLEIVNNHGSLLPKLGCESLPNWLRFPQLPTTPGLRPLCAADPGSWFKGLMGLQVLEEFQGA
jgi:hypothetical protein